MCRTVLLAVLGTVALGCRPVSEPVKQEVEVSTELQSLVDAVVAGNEAIRGTALHVEAPRMGLIWEGAAGLADPVEGTPMTPGTPVRIASNTKTYVAAAVLRLWEDGRLDLDDPIARHLPAVVVELLRGDGYDTESMTIRHLLTHTSGLFDHSEPESYGEAITAAPGHEWTRLEQLTLAMESGEPHASPGEIYTYCDTGYVILGEIVEQASGQPLGEAVRELLGYRRLGLGSTWWEKTEPRPQGVPDRAHQFLGGLDTFAFDPSFDLYGGGGLVATVGDLGRFFRALFTDGVFSDSQTAEIMLSTLDGLRARPDAEDAALPPGAYRMGVWVVDVEGSATYRHTGFWGTLATYVPDLDLTLACTVNQHEGKEALQELTRSAIALVRDRSRSSPSG